MAAWIGTWRSLSLRSNKGSPAGGPFLLHAGFDYEGEATDGRRIKRNACWGRMVVSCLQLDRLTRRAGEFRAGGSNSDPLTVEAIWLTLNAAPTPVGA